MTQRSIRHQAVTLRQVAAHAAVSRQTVSNVLNAPHRVDPTTLAKVTRSIDELRYRPNRSARSLSTGNAGLIGYCSTRRSDGSANPVMDAFLHELSLAVEAQGGHILLFTVPPGQAALPVYADLVAQRAVDGFVLAETQVDDPRHRWLTERGVRFVSFGRTWPCDGVEPGSWVDVDGAAACAELVARLHALGHRRIGFVGWSSPVGAVADRQRGWRGACARLGLPVDGLCVPSDGDTAEAGERAAEALLDRAGPLTAIMASSDMFAFGAMRALTRRGLRPGVDVAVTGFDDSPTASAITPALTTIRQPVARIAATALRLLQTPPGDPEGVLLPGEIIFRASADITTTTLASG